MAANTDKLRKGFYGPPTTLSGPISDSATTIPLSDTTGMPTDTAIDLVIDRVDANGDETPENVETVTVVISGNNGTNAVRAVEDTAKTHSAGAVVEVLYTAATHDDIVDGFLADHDQAGHHKTLKDANGNELIEFPSAVASAVNHIKVTNATTGNPAVIEAAGDNTNIDLPLRPKGTGLLRPRAWDGWIDLGQFTLTYASATTFTIAGQDVRDHFPVGAKLKLTQTTAKYFYVVSRSFSTDTTITVTGGSDYSLANAAITSPYVSYAQTPHGHPLYFNHTLTETGWFGTPTSTLRFKLDGTTCIFQFNVSGTSDSASTEITLPITARSNGGFNFEGVLGLATDNGTPRTGACRQYIDPSSNPNRLVMVTDMASTGWTASGTKTVRGTAIYEVA